MSDPIPPDLNDPDTDPGTAFDQELYRPPSAATRQLVALDPERPGLPWIGLGILVIYLVACISTVWTMHISSDAYKINQLMIEASQLVGPDQGRDRELDQLAEAAQIYLNALGIDPDFKPAHDRLETIRWRFQERRQDFPEELARQQVMVSRRSSLGKRESGGLFGAMPVNAEKRFGLAELRSKLITRLVWIGLGGIVILGWVLLSHHRAKREHLAKLRKARAELDKGSALY
ncbi:MAG: hypothetical protein P1V51_13945 [Deltaproteobacteria bacterium]|nr:hypothetical protein [Deltaproteobacteria bacterium]